MSTATTHIETEKQLVPELRFKEFEGDYSKRILKDFTKINQGLQIPISERYSEQVEGSYFYITNEFLRKGSKKSYFIKNPTESVICTEEEILMTRTGNTGQVVTGVHGAFHNNFFKIKFDETCEKWYLYFFLTSYITQHKILTLAGTSTIPDLNHGDFYKLKITMPKYPEQQKIASFLSAVDEKIQQLSKKKALLEDYKKGVMQQLFSGQLRFKDENGNPYPDWEESKLKELVSTPISDGPHLTPKFIKDGVPFLSVNNIVDSKIDFKNVRTISNEDHLEFSRKCKPKKNDLLLGKAASVGKIAIVETDLEFNIWSPLAMIRIKETYVSKYFYYRFQTQTLQKRIKRFINSSSQGNIGMGDIGKLIFEFPKSKEEQQKIATYLSSIDTKIEAVNNQITQTQTFKKGLLQQMFV